MKKDLENGIIGKPFLSEIKLLWPRSEEDYKSGTGWRSQYGDVLINQAIHFIDIAMWFFGKPINIHSISSKVKESISCNDTASIILEFPDNVLFNLICTTACHSNPPVIFNIYGAKGKLNYKNNHISNFMWKIINKTLFKNKVAPLHHQINDFIDAIINNRPPAVTVKEAFEVLRVIKECE